MLRSIIAKSFITLAASAALLTPALAAPAMADGSGTGTGNGSCSYANVGWKFTKGTGAIKASDRSDCYNSGNKVRDLRRVGASACTGPGLVGVFSLTDRRTGQWATWPQRNLNAADRAHASAAITKSNAPRAVEQAAKRKLAAENNVVVCVFKRDL